MVGNRFALVAATVPNPIDSRLPEDFFPWRHGFSRFAAAATLFLIFVGGLVTSTGSGLAVPDWPLSYGRFFPPMVGGIFYEHGHRMVAGAVGLLTAALALWTWFEEPRRWVRWLAVAALGTVVLQAVLGGITVLFLLPTTVSVVHACLGQIFFCLLVSLAVVTGRTWLTPHPRTGPSRLRTLAPVLVAATFVQLTLGAVMRHTGAGLAIPDFPLAFGRLWPDLGSTAVTIHFAHRLWGCLVAALAWSALIVTLRAHREHPLLWRPAVLAGALVTAQILLGGLVIWTGRAVLPTTVHVATGAAVLGTGVALTLRSRLLIPTVGDALADRPAEAHGVPA